MKQYTINAKYASVFGMDVHARSVSISGLDRMTGEKLKKRFTGCSPAAEIAQWMKENSTAPHYAAYESGCTGFELCRNLRKMGIDTDVIAVSSIARSQDERQRKNDKTDAKRLLSELLMFTPTYSVVWTPDVETEAARDLARCRIDAVVATKRAKQQLSSFLMRRDHVWDEKTPTGRIKTTWGGEHLAWLKRIKFDDVVSQEVLKDYRRAIDECVERTKDINSSIEKYAQKSRWKPYVDALTLLMGIDTQTAFLAVATFGDFSRFKNGRSVSRWLGTIPKENSSGEHEAHGHITRAGDSNLRQALVEGASAISLRKNAVKKPKPGSSVPADIAALCVKANRRLKARFDHLRDENRLHANKARVAVVNELVRWIWYIGLCVQKGGVIGDGK
jgi:transposase